MSYYNAPELMGDALDRMAGGPGLDGLIDQAMPGAGGGTKSSTGGGGSRAAAPHPYENYRDADGNWVQRDTVTGQITIIERAPIPVKPPTAPIVDWNNDGYNDVTGLPVGVRVDSNSPSGYYYQGKPVNADGSLYTGPGKAAAEPRIVTANGRDYIWDPTSKTFVPAPGITPPDTPVRSYNVGGGGGASIGGGGGSFTSGGLSSANQGPTARDLWNQQNAASARADAAAQAAAQRAWQEGQNALDRQQRAQQIAQQEAQNKQALAVQAANLYDTRAGEFVKSISSTDPAAFDAMLATGMGPSGDTADPASFNLQNAIGNGGTALSPRLLNMQQAQLNGVRQLGQFAQQNGVGGFLNPNALSGLNDPLTQPATPQTLARGGTIARLGVGGDIGYGTDPIGDQSNVYQPTPAPGTIGVSEGTIAPPPGPAKPWQPVRYLGPPTPAGGAGGSGDAVGPVGQVNAYQPGTLGTGEGATPPPVGPPKPWQPPRYLGPPTPRFGDNSDQQQGQQDNQQGGGDQAFGDIVPPVVTPPAPAPAPAIPAAYRNDPTIPWFWPVANALGYDASKENAARFISGKGLPSLVDPKPVYGGVDLNDDPTWAGSTLGEFLHGVGMAANSKNAAAWNEAKSYQASHGLNPNFPTFQDPLANEMVTHSTPDFNPAMHFIPGVGWSADSTPGTLFDPKTGGYDPEAVMGGFLSNENPEYTSMAGDTYYRKEVGHTRPVFRNGVVSREPTYEVFKRGRTGPVAPVQTNAQKANIAAAYEAAGKPGAMRGPNGYIDKKTGLWVPTPATRARGGDVPGMAIVGDSLNGKPNPEMVVAPQGAKVIPLSKLGMNMDDVRRGNVKLGMHADGGTIPGDGYTTPPADNSWPWAGFWPTPPGSRRPTPIHSDPNMAPPPLVESPGMYDAPPPPTPAAPPAPSPAPAPGTNASGGGTAASGNNGVPPGGSGAPAPGAPPAWDNSWWDLPVDTQFDPKTGLPINDVSKIRQGVKYRDLNPRAANFANILPTIRARWAAGMQAKLGVPVQDTLADEQRYRQQAIPLGVRTIGF